MQGIQGKCVFRDRPLCVHGRSPKNQRIRRCRTVLQASSSGHTPEVVTLRNSKVCTEQCRQLCNCTQPSHTHTHTHTRVNAAYALQDGWAMRQAKCPFYCCSKLAQSVSHALTISFSPPLCLPAVLLAYLT